MAGDIIIDFHTIHFDFRGNSIIIRVTNEDQVVVLSGEIGKGIIPAERPDITHSDDFTSVTFSWVSLGSICVTHKKHATGLEYDIEWKALPSCKQLVDTFLMRSAHWYGAAQVRRQHWPIEKWVRPEAAFVAGDSFKDQYGGVQERYWLSSRGVAIIVNKDVPLFVSMNNKNDETLSFVSKWAAPYKNIASETVTLQYRLFLSTDVKKAHELATGEVVCKPNAIPDELIFKHPIWSTWARYKKDINQGIILGMAKEIKDNGFKACQIEIDDDWTPRYGDMEFNTKKFPDAGKMMEELEKEGFRVTVWVHPFCSPLSQAAGESHWIKSGFLPGHTTWWNGLGKILDITKPSAADWFKNNLLRIKEKYKLTSFKFDAGEVNWLPNMARPEVPWSNPNVYATKYAELCYECDKETRALEVRVGVHTQHLPIFIRMMDKDSNWGYDNGLKSLIPHALTFSILGYPFILPDMIGGNAYSSSGHIGSSSALPERELYIRWLQVNVFMPALQYSIVPWQYDAETVKICKELTELHEKYAPNIIELAKESVQTGAPIVRPMWWIAPTDMRALYVDDQFLLGDDILVAPVVEKGAESRDLYLPSGFWHDELRKTVIEGPKILVQYEAKLHELPHFTRRQSLNPITEEEEEEVAYKLVTEEDEVAVAEAEEEVKEAVAEAVVAGEVVAAEATGEVVVPELVPDQEIEQIVLDTERAILEEQGEATPAPEL